MSNPTRVTEFGTLDLVRVADVESIPINWLWPGRIAKGKVSLIAGHPGLGKSTLTASIAAIVSSGGEWPVDGIPTQAGDVVILSAEDDISDTLRPRLVAAGADIERVRVIKGVINGDRQEFFNLQSHTNRLEEIDASLMIIDPITAYLGRVDSHKNAEVQSILVPLAELAAAKEMAIVCVTHLNKAEKLNDISRVSGSMAFVSISRAVFMVTPDEQDNSRRFFMPLKSNNGADSGGLAFRIEPSDLGDGIETSMVIWEPEPILSQSMQNANQTALTRATEYLMDILSPGPVGANEIKDQGRAAGHSWATLRRASEYLQVSKTKRADGPWQWELSSSLIQDAQEVQTPSSETDEQVEHLCQSNKERGADE